MDSTAAFPHIPPDPGRVNCHACGRYNLEGCTRCGQCHTHCACFTCDECVGRPWHTRSLLCKRCGHCRRSGRCACGRVKPHALNLETHVPARVVRELRKVPPLRELTRPMGVEIEVSSKNNSRVNAYMWTSTNPQWERDGSVTGDSPGEFILGPLCGPKHFEAVQAELSTYLPHIRAQVNSSCGLHVHVDARDFSPLELRRVVLCYHLMEGTFYNLVAPDRRGNRYSRVYTPGEWEALLSCGGLSDPREVIRHIQAALYLGRDQQECRSNIAVKRDSSRYHGLNLHAFFHQGTLEYRMHEGCVDPSRIRNWMLWCGWFTEVASRLRDEEVARLITPQDFLYGNWKRTYGVVQIPREVQAFVEGGRVSQVSERAMEETEEGFTPPPPRRRATSIVDNPQAARAWSDGASSLSSRAEMYSTPRRQPNART